MSGIEGEDAPHIPVMLGEVLETITPHDGETYIDGTFGAGGYTGAILARADCRVLAIDRDPSAIQAGQAVVAASGGRLTLAHGNYGDLDAIAAASGFGQIDGIVLDIGVSSMQLDQGARGFSFMADGPLDMRMAQAGQSAADVVNEMAEDDLADVLFQLGEERQSRRIARAIGKARTTAPITTTGQLAHLIERVLGKARGHEKHPATRTFQALRIFVNDELGELRRGLRAAERVLTAGGRLVVVTFHSLEDRIVKQFLATRTGRTPGGSRHGPPVATTQPAPSFRFVNHRPLTPSQEEIARNPRARSAKLRFAIRTDAPPQPDQDHGDPE